MTEPNTSSYELREDEVEQIISALEDTSLAPGGHDFVRGIIDDLRDQMPSKTDAVAFSGLPGAGKSRTAKKLAKVYDTDVVSMGDAIRADHKEKTGYPPTSEELGDWAADWREDAPEEIPEKVVELASELDSDPVIIDGVRSVTDYETLENHFDNFYLIDVNAEFETRLERLQDRGREGEEDFDRVDLAERDMNELDNLGYAALLEGNYVDLSLDNGKKSNLTIALSNLVENNLPFDIEDGRPLGLSFEIDSSSNSKLSWGTPGVVTDT